LVSWTQAAEDIIAAGKEAEKEILAATTPA
jgi:hypothetical protein